MGLAGVGKVGKGIVIQEPIVELDPRRRAVLVVLEPVKILDVKRLFGHAPKLSFEPGAGLGHYEPRALLPMLSHRLIPGPAVSTPVGPNFSKLILFRSHLQGFRSPPSQSYQPNLIGYLLHRLPAHEAYIAVGERPGLQGQRHGRFYPYDLMGEPDGYRPVFLKP